MNELMQIHGTGRQDPLLAGKLDLLIAESRERKAASMSEVTWRNRTVRIKNNKVSFHCFNSGFNSLAVDLPTFVVIIIIITVADNCRLEPINRSNS